MSTTLEQRVRLELEREHARIDALRRDPARLKPEWQAEHERVVAELEADWERARDAIEALARAASGQASSIGEEFGRAWRELKSRARAVCRN
jgi:hypothetical protein